MRGAAVTASGPPVADTWVVAAGDHLWAIAAETLSERHGVTDERAIAEYWMRLIEHNREIVGPDPDLVHPGEVLELPVLEGP